MRELTLPLCATGWHRCRGDPLDRSLTCSSGSWESCPQGHELRKTSPAPHKMHRSGEQTLRLAWGARWRGPQVSLPQGGEPWGAGPATPLSWGRGYALCPLGLCHLRQLGELILEVGELPLSRSTRERVHLAWAIQCVPDGEDMDELGPRAWEES